MPTISSRPQVEDEDDGGAYTVNEIAGIITDGVLYVMPKGLPELRLTLHTICRTMWNTEAIADFFIYDSAQGGCDVGFKLYDDPHYHVITIK